VDDEASVRKLLRRCFENEQYNVLEASTGNELLMLLENHSIDLITLDLKLGDSDGLDLARQIRTSSNVPIIMVSGRGELIDSVVGLEIGADDYISKPFELRDVLARARAVLRRSRPAQQKAISAGDHAAIAEAEPVFRFADWTLRPRNRSFTADDGQQCELTTNEFDLLEVFVRNPQQVLSRDRIMDLLKGHDWHPNDRSIDNQIARLRKKLRQHIAGNCIETIRGVGYLLATNVEYNRRSE
jgi:DNA-binding response OmpR family regulator